MNKVRLNHEINAPQVRLVGVDGAQLGVVSLREALDAAAEAGLDLAEIAPGAQPPVAKILDYGKFRYEQTKQLQKSRQHQKQVEVKEVRIGLKIGAHDLEVKLNRARKFLLEGQKVKFSLRFKGREISRPALGQEILAKALAQLDDIAVADSPATMSGRDLSLILGMKKDAKAKDA